MGRDLQLSGSDILGGGNRAAYLQKILLLAGVRSRYRWGRGPGFCHGMEGLESGLSHPVAGYSPFVSLCVVAGCVSEFH